MVLALSNSVDAKIKTKKLGLYKVQDSNEKKSRIGSVGIRRLKEAQLVARLI